LPRIAEELADKLAGISEPSPPCGRARRTPGTPDASPQEDLFGASRPDETPEDDAHAPEPDAALEAETGGGS
jgi:hypothetical protein